MFYIEIKEGDKVICESKNYTDENKCKKDKDDLLNKILFADPAFLTFEDKNGREVTLHTKRLINSSFSIRKDNIK